MEAIILAGGQGTRLGEITKDLPKSLVPINGKPFIEHLLHYWINQGINHFILAVGQHSDQIIDHVGSSFEDVAVDYAIEHSPLGTGGALALAKDFLNSRYPFAVVNGDTIQKIQLDSLLRFHILQNALATIALQSVPTQESSPGNFRVDKDNRVVEYILDSSSETTDPLCVATGTFLFNPSALDDFSIDTFTSFPVSLESEILNKIIPVGNGVVGFLSEDAFWDIGTPDRLKLAEKFLEDLQ